MKVISFYIVEYIDNGLADVFLSFGNLSPEDFEKWDQDIVLEKYEDKEFDFEKNKEKLFSIINNRILEGNDIKSEVKEMCYVIRKNNPDLIDYYNVVQNYINEFCEFIDQDYAVYFRVNYI